MNYTTKFIFFENQILEDIMEKQPAAKPQLIKDTIHFSKTSKVIFGILFIIYMLILMKLILFKYASIQQILEWNVDTYSSYI